MANKTLVIPRVQTGDDSVAAKALSRVYEYRRSVVGMGRHFGRWLVGSGDPEPLSRNSAARQKL
jgi:hypothetical protein